ncbi:TonB-dependent receptor plug domain-containing protein [Leptospira idonii]|uniref:Porin n=1 Tax=Leptospira idonii TaxID=1193500 RepID=A0A4R9LZF3_9LEPT|nr:TonB-dependent receptor plug domain-containing protein [Leptospira idonii]TGN19743.1 porin [Leptospira idonii]
MNLLRSIFLFSCLTFAFCFLFVFSIRAQAQGILEVKIRLVRSQSGKPVSNAVVVSKQAGAAGTSDAEGLVVLKFPGSGYYQLRIATSDKVEVVTKEIRYNKQEILVALAESVGSSGIVVSGERDKTPLSRYGLVQDEIKRIPGVAGDSLKAIQTIPGIAIGVPVGVLPTVFTNVSNSLTGVPYSNSERGDLSLRGGGTRQNQYFFDGFPLPYPFHLGNQSSVLNNNLIRSFDVYTGAFPSKYGFATGGIIAIEGTDKVESNRSVVNVNFFLADIYNQTKINPSLSMVSSGRKNYPNLVLLQAYPAGIPEDAKFAEYQDFQWKMIWDISNEHKLTVQTFGTRDRQAYTKQQANYERGGSDPRPPTGLDRNFRTDGIRHIWKGKWFRNSISYSRTEFNEFFEVRVSNPATAETIFGLQNRTSDYITYAEERLELDLIEEHLRFEGGLQFRGRETNLKGENISSANPLFGDIFNNLLNSSAQFRSVIDGDRIRYNELAGFGEFQVKWQGIRFHPGARVDTYSGSGEKNLSPRITGGYVFESTKTSILAGHGVHYNSPVSVEQLSTRSGNPNLFMERSEHNSLGVSQEIGQGWLIKVEGFHNIFQNIIVADNYAIDPYSPNTDLRLVVNNPTNAQRNPFIPRNLNYSNSGYGHSEGIEIFIKKSRNPREESGSFGWISYTNSITKRINNQPRLTSTQSSDRALANSTRTLLSQGKLGTNYINYYDDNSYEVLYNNDKEELYDLDRTHILNCVFGYRFNPDWQIGGRFRYFSGTPYTPIVSADRASQAATFGVNLYFPKYSDNYNSDRFRPFHQIDIRIDMFDHYSWGYINVYLELVNFYGRMNQDGYNFDNFKAYQRGVNPSATYDTVNSPYIQSQRPNGSPINLPLINLGMEARF